MLTEKGCGIFGEGVGNGEVVYRGMTRRRNDIGVVRYFVESGRVLAFFVIYVRALRGGGGGVIVQIRSRGWVQRLKLYYGRYFMW